MKLRLSIVVMFVALSGSAQFNFSDTAFMCSPPPGDAAPFSPTNIAGYPALAWYVASDYVTNGSTVSLPDRWTNSFHLTNSAASTRWPVFVSSDANINNQAALDFDGGTSSTGDYLKQVAYTSSQPHEVWFVAAQTNKNAWAMQWAGQYSTNSHALYRNASTSQQAIGAENQVNGGNGSYITNKWIIWDVIIRGASSEGYTNNVLFVSGNAGSQHDSGMIVGIYRDLDTFSSKMRFAEMICYGAPGGSAIPGTNTVTRSNIFNYLTNKYNIGP